MFILKSEKKRIYNYSCDICEKKYSIYIIYNEIENIFSIKNCLDNENKHEIFGSEIQHTYKLKCNHIICNFCLCKQLYGNLDYHLECNICKVSTSIFEIQYVKELKEILQIHHYYYKMYFERLFNIILNKVRYLNLDISIMDDYINKTLDTNYFPELLFFIYFIYDTEQTDFDKYEHYCIKYQYISEKRLLTIESDLQETHKIIELFIPKDSIKFKEYIDKYKNGILQSKEISLNILDSLIQKTENIQS